MSGSWNLWGNSCRWLDLESPSTLLKALYMWLTVFSTHIEPFPSSTSTAFSVAYGRKLPQILLKRIVSSNASLFIAEN